MLFVLLFFTLCYKQMLVFLTHKNILYFIMWVINQKKEKRKYSSTKDLVLGIIRLLLVFTITCIAL